MLKVTSFIFKIYSFNLKYYINTVELSNLLITFSQLELAKK